MWRRLNVFLDKFKSHIVQHLCERRVVWLQIPRFVKDGMMGRFDNPAINIGVPDIFVSSCISQEYTRKIMSI